MEIFWMIFVLAFGLLDYIRRQREKELGIRPGVPRSKNLADFMFYDFNIKD